LRADLAHRPLHSESEEFVKFQSKTEKRRVDLISKYPFLETRI